MPEFFETRMGRQFYDGTMPAIKDAILKLATAIEQRNALLKIQQEKQNESLDSSNSTKK